jgi:hypothetical protein
MVSIAACSQKNDINRRADKAAVVLTTKGHPARQTPFNTAIHIQGADPRSHDIYIII